MSAFWFALLTALIWGIVPLIEKQGLARSDPTIGVFARSAGVIVGVLILGLWWSPWKALANLNAGSFALLALGGFLASVVGQMMFYHALKVGHVSQVTPVSGAYPLVAAILAWVFFREPITAGRLVGVLFIVIGVLLLRR
ncbi:MAG: EamA family transporter [Candidatus Omnitrophica bacterium]|nr:EamA family transporter [Candidatus Omnitrophota bacterium]